MHVLFVTACGLAAVQPALALDAINVITFTLTVYEEGDTTMKGTVTTVKLSRFRATTKDIIQLLGEAKEMTFSPQAKLLLIRRNIEQGEEEGSFIVRDGTQPDCDVSEFFTVSSEGDIETGTFDEATGRYRNTILSITTLTLTIPESVSFTLRGLATELVGSLRIEGEELPGGLTSFLAKMSGQGTSPEEGEEDASFLLDGLLKLGPTRLVPSAAVN
jgi:hypothetical protein